MNLRTLLLGGTLLGGALLVACGDDDDSEDATATSTATEEAVTGTPDPDATETPEEARARRIAEWRANVLAILQEELPLLDTEQRIVDLLEITPLLPPDAIPSIDAPQFDTTEAASEWLEPLEPVIAFERNGDARAYPLQILTWHEIVNDEVGGEPVIVTYCPLCNSALAFSRVVDGEVREFGVSGKLRRSDLIMYDRTNQSLWQQLSGEAIIGSDVGTVLEFLPAQIVAFREFQEAHPSGLVLNKETGVYRDYGMNPYAFYDRTTSFVVDVPEFGDERLDAKERVLAVEIGDESVAFPFSALTELVAIETELGGEPLVALWQSGQVSALDSPFIIGGRNVGSAAAFRPFVDGDRLTFEGRDGAIFDVETGSEWDVFGRATEGPLAGAQLEPVISASHFWFAWSVFKPDTRLVFESDSGAGAVG